MRKMTFLVCLVAVCVVAVEIRASSTPYLYEGYAYEVGGGSVNQQSSATATPWNSQWDGSGEVLAESLAYPDLLTTGGAVKITNQTTGRSFSGGAFGPASGAAKIVWASVLFNSPTFKHGHRVRFFTAPGGSSNHGVGFDLGTRTKDSVTYGAIKPVVADNNWNSGMQHSDPVEIATLGETHLAIMKITLQSTSTRLDLWIDPSDFSTQSSLGDAHAWAQDYDASLHYSSAGVYTRGLNSDNPVYYDEIRLDSDFLAVVPRANTSDLVPEPLTLSGLALAIGGLGGYLRRRRA